ncbi:MAG: ribonuclease P protein component [Rikenellaceae bacterium]|jgi:ribonuclease P protein component|nr:ribonuclease P protein component [Rikenellaceae bacterium]
MTGSATLPKAERLRSERLIDQLFSSGRGGCVYPLKYRVLVREVGEGEAAASVMFSVPKKLFKRAWKRNLIRRRMKESYRQAKTPLVEKLASEGRHADIALICAAEKNNIPDYKTIDDAVRKIVSKIVERS